MNASVNMTYTFYADELALMAKIEELRDAIKAIDGLDEFELRQCRQSLRVIEQVMYAKLGRRAVQQTDDLIDDAGIDTQVARPSRDSFAARVDHHLAHPDEPPPLGPDEMKVDTVTLLCAMCGKIVMVDRLPEVYKFLSWLLRKPVDITELVGSTSLARRIIAPQRTWTGRMATELSRCTDMLAVNALVEKVYAEFGQYETVRRRPAGA